MIGDETGEYETNPEHTFVNCKWDTNWHQKITIRYRWVGSATHCGMYGGCTEVRMGGAQCSFYINCAYNDFLEHWLHND